MKIFRLGKFDPEAEDDKSRPIKVIFESPEVQTKVISSAIKLKNAPENLKKIGISHDLSEEQRAKAKALHAEALERSKNSTEFVFKVRGPPDNMTIKQIKINTA